MQSLLKALVVFYVAMATYYFITWSESFEQEPIISYSSIDKCLSRVALAIATILWPIVVPIAYILLLKAKNPKILGMAEGNDSSSLHHLLVSVFLSNLLALSGLAAFTYIEFVYHF
ncbi:MAG: hypothetical protein JOZ78_16445 [Chroococcidiopsidaceae cyanobacterium CP_BM_ER_R8_30]|nr:hypothetical protein [Chroococcidiopsidaceae cyanobacterium CP_BM_ER_R8_30]